MSKNTTPKAPKKPPRQRGYKIQKSFDPKGNVSFDKVPRSGYGTAFLRLFTLFLAILVLLNILLGTGYTGYRMAVHGLYSVTETLGELTSSALQYIGGTITGSGKAEYEDEIEIGGTTINAMNVLHVYTKDDIEIKLYICADEYNSQGVNVFRVYESNHSDFNINDEISVNWFFGWTLKNLENEEKIRYFSRTVIEGYFT